MVQRIYPDRQVIDTDDELVAAYAFPPAPPGTASVRATMVSTVDGAAYGHDGRSASISSAADRAVFAAARGLADAVLVGARTADIEEYAAPTADDIPLPSLAAAIGRHRQEYGQGSLPVIAVVSNNLDFDPRSALFARAMPPSIVLTSDRSPVERRRTLSRVADVVIAGAHAVDPDLAVDALIARGLPRIQCEGGPRLLAQFLDAGVIGELCLTVTPWLIGGDARRILDGPLATPASAELIHVLEAEATLFTRWRLPTAHPTDPRTSARS